MRFDIHLNADPSRRPRDIGPVIADMLGVIPESETELRAALKHVAWDAGFKAPECQSVCWQKGAALLLRHLPAFPLTIEWCRKARAIWMGESNG